MPFYGADVWDPVLIVSEMVMMQAVFYVLGGITLTANALIGGESVSLRLFFDAEAVTFSTAPGVGVAAACSLGLMLIVERTQKCWDFGLTLYLVHVAVCTMYQGFPTAWPWWVVTSLSCTSMILLGERLCLANESQEISVEGFIQSIRDHTRGMDSARDEQPYPDSASEDGSLPPPSPQKAGSRTLTMQVDEHAEHGPPLMRALSAQRRRDDSAAPDRVPDVGSSPG